MAASFILYPLTEVVGTFPTLREYRLLILAIVALRVLLLMPQGITPRVRNKIEIVCQRCKNRNVRRHRECRVCHADLK